MNKVYLGEPVINDGRLFRRIVLHPEPRRLAGVHVSLRLVRLHRLEGHLQHLRVFFFKQKTAYEISACLVGSEMCIRDRETHGRLRGVGALGAEQRVRGGDGRGRRARLGLSLV